jgi:hypothetical protein
MEPASRRLADGISTHGHLEPRLLEGRLAFLAVNVQNNEIADSARYNRYPAAGILAIPRR